MLNGLLCDFCREPIAANQPTAEAQRGVVHEACLNKALDALAPEGQHKVTPLERLDQLEWLAQCNKINRDLANGANENLKEALAEIARLQNENEKRHCITVQLQDEIERLSEAAEVLRQALVVSAHGYHALSRHGIGLWEECASLSCKAVQRDVARAATLTRKG